MPIDRIELGKRIREARKAMSLTQGAVAAKLSISRSAVAQIELGNRAVSSIELEKLAYIFGRDIQSFLSEEFGTDTLTILFRANPDLLNDEEIAAALRKAIALGRELSNLENLLGLTQASYLPSAYPLKPPVKKWEAIRQGEALALDERRRLDLGDGPIANIVAVLEREGIRSHLVPLPNNISGITVNDPDAGILVLVNEHHHVVRRRFSFAHEYAHVLLDKGRKQTVSRGEDRDELIEIRANSFAASFLSPESGVRRLIAALGKEHLRNKISKLYDEDNAIEVQKRTIAGDRRIQIYDILLLAHCFGVSSTSALFRLRNLDPPFIDNEELETLKSDLESSKADEIKRALKLEETPPVPRENFSSRFLALALEAFRREKITRSKLAELSLMVDITKEVLEKLIIDLQLEGSQDESGTE